MTSGAKPAPGGWRAGSRSIRCGRGLGHSNISQTSTYLSTTFEAQHDVMGAFDERLASLHNLLTGSVQGGESATRPDTQASNIILGKHHRRRSGDGQLRLGVQEVPGSNPGIPTNLSTMGEPV